MNNSSQTPISRQAQAAHVELERALSLHFQGNKAGALKALHNAIKQDESLKHEPIAINLAKEITGLPVMDALQRVVDQNTSRELVNAARREQNKTPQAQRQRFLLYVLGVLLVIFAGFLISSIRSGGFDSYTNALQLQKIQNQKANIGGYEYYFSIPKGDVPEGGWPLVVVFHGYGGNGAQMLGLAAVFNDAGAIFVAPTLGEYQPNPGNGPLEPVNRILTEVGSQYPIQSRGAILLGHSQGGSFAYRYSVYYSKQVAGVVTAGAPEFDAISPTRNIPYIFTWGELDGLQEFVMPSVYPLQTLGLNVRTYIVPGVGHEMSQYAIDQVIRLLNQ